MPRSRSPKATWRTAALVVAALSLFALTLVLVRSGGSHSEQRPPVRARSFTIPERVATIQNLERVATIKPMRSVPGSLEDTQVTPVP